MEPLPFSQINQTGHPEPMIATEWYSWLVTHLVDSNLPPVTTFGYLNLCLLAVSFLLNLYLSLVIHGKRSNQSRTHSLMKNIFVTNVLTAGISLPLLVHTHLPVNWPITPLLSSIVFKVVPSLHILSQFISSVSLSILAVDQCQSLCAKPNSRLTNVFSPAFLSKLLWAIAVLLCLPTILYSSKLTLDVPSDTPSSVGWCTVCRLDVSSLVASGSAPGSQSSALSRWLNSLLLAVYLCTLFLIPLLISTVSHGKTYLHLLEHRHRYSHVHDLQKRIRTSDREAIRMLTIVLILYTLTWLPSHLAQIIWHTTRPWEPSFSEHTARLWSIILLGSRQVTLLGTSLLPVVYLLFGRSLRENFFNHLYTVLYLCRPSFNGYHLRQSGANRQFSTDSSSSADCKTNSLQKLLSDKDRGGNMT